MMKNLDPANPESKQELWKDIVSRAQFGDVLVNDTTGETDVRFAGCEDADFGDEVKAASKAVADAI